MWKGKLSWLFLFDLFMSKVSMSKISDRVKGPSCWALLEFSQTKYINQTKKKKKEKFSMPLASFYNCWATTTNCPKVQNAGKKIFRTRGSWGEGGLQGNVIFFHPFVSHEKKTMVEGEGVLFCEISFLVCMSWSTQIFPNRCINNIFH